MKITSVQIINAATGPNATNQLMFNKPRALPPTKKVLITNTHANNLSPVIASQLVIPSREVASV